MSPRRREETIYVDYIESDAQHQWHDPTRFDEFSPWLLISERNPVLRLMKALSDAGCLVSPALEVIAGTWRSVTLDDDFSWNSVHDLNVATLEAMKKQGLLNDPAQEACSAIANEWLYPLHSIDLRKQKVHKNELTEVQERWNPAS